MIWLIVAFEVFLMLELRSRIRMFNPAESTCWFILVSQIVYANGTTFFESNQDWLTRSFIYHPNVGLILYTVMFVAFYCSTLGLKVERIKSLREEFTQATVQALKYNPHVFTIVVIVVLLHLALSDLQTLWFYDKYLLRPNDAPTLAQSFGEFIRRVLWLAGFVSSFYFGANIAARRSVAASAWCVPALAIVVLVLAGASRLAFLLIIVALFTILALTRRNRVGWIIAFLPVSLVALSGALNARNEHAFGISALPFIIGRAFSGELQSADLVSNLFQGILSTSDGLDYAARFSLRYKVLSFSPLPSLIDHFDTFRDAEQVRLFSYIPMSAITESLKFGVPYFVLLIGTFCIGFRLTIRNVRKIGPLYSLLTIGLLSSFIASGAYPVRNVYKQLLVWIAAGLITAYVRGRRAGARPGDRPGGAPNTLAGDPRTSSVAGSRA